CRPARGRRARARGGRGRRGGASGSQDTLRPTMTTPSDRRRDPEEAAAIAAIHDRYVREIVEDLGLCPYARRCREGGRLARPIFDLLEGEPGPERCADEIARVSRERPDVEVLLLTFLVPEGHRWRAAYAFEDHVRALREAYTRASEGPRLAPRYYMVAFHPAPRGADPPRPLTQDSLVPRIRRTPDPVIQCIRADLLDGLRRQAQVAAE